MASEPSASTTNDCPPSLGRALNALADTAIDQARDLAMVHLDRWADRLHARCATAIAPTTSTSMDLSPVIVGAIAGIAVAWAISGRGPGS